MAQISTWEIVLVYDALAFEGCRWWAHAAPAGGEWDGYGVASRLCDNPGEALLDVAGKVSRLTETPGRQESPTE